MAAYAAVLVAEVQRLRLTASGLVPQSEQEAQEFGLARLARHVSVNDCRPAAIAADHAVGGCGTSVGRDFDHITINHLGHDVSADIALAACGITTQVARQATEWVRGGGEVQLQSTAAAAAVLHVGVVSGDTGADESRLRKTGWCGCHCVWWSGSGPRYD